MCVCVCLVCVCVCVGCIFIRSSKEPQHHQSCGFYSVRFYSGYGIGDSGGIKRTQKEVQG